MPMKLLLIGILLTELAFGIANSQTVEIVKQVSLSQSSADKRFEFLNSKTNVLSLTFVGTIKARGRDKMSSIPMLFFKLRDKAQEFGANCFKINSYDKGSNVKEAMLTLDVYSGTDQVLKNNSSYEEKNTIFVFLDDKNSAENYTFNINEIERKITSGTYYRYQIREKQNISIDAGGFFDPQFKFRWKEGKAPLFFTLTDFGLDKDAKDYDYAGKYFNTKRLNPIGKNVGQLLVALIKPI